MQPANAQILKKVSGYVSGIFRKKKMAPYCFHNMEHTLTVVRAARWLGLRCGLSAQDLETVQLAAWFHDTGYLNGWEGHEAGSATIACRFFRQSWFTPKRINQIINCILATRFSCQPNTLMEKVLCDADLINLARPDYFRRALLLKIELERTCNIVQTPVDFLQNEIRFLRGHRYHTDFARDFLEKQKMAHLAALKQKLQQFQ